MDKIWKPVKLEGYDWLDGHFRISEYGEVEQIYKQRNFLLKPILSRKENALYISMLISSITVNKSKKIILTRLIVLHFKEIPKDKSLKVVTFIDDTLDDSVKYHYSNLELHFSKQRKKPIKKAVGVPVLFKIPVVREFKKRKAKTIPYYEFKNDAIFNNRTDNFVLKGNNLLAKIEEKFKGKIDHEKFVKFKNLTDQDREMIQIMIPYKRYNPLKKW